MFLLFGTYKYLKKQHLSLNTIIKNSDNKPWAYICAEAFFAGLIFRGAFFPRGLLLEGILPIINNS